MEEHSVFDHKPRENGIHSQYALPHLQHNIGDRIYSSGGHPNDIYPNGGKILIEMIKMYFAKSSKKSALEFLTNVSHRFLT
jgi:hypothetical protein